MCLLTQVISWELVMCLKNRLAPSVCSHNTTYLHFRVFSLIQYAIFHMINFISLLLIHICVCSVTDTPLTMGYLTDVADADASSTVMVSFDTLPLYYRDLSAYQKVCMHNLPRGQVYFNLNYKLDQKPQWDFSPSFLPSDNIRLFGLRVPWTVTFPVRVSRETHFWDW